MASFSSPRQALGTLQRLPGLVAMSVSRPGDLGFSDKLLISGALTGTDHFVRIFFRLASTILITRLLAPEIFGLFAIIMSFHIVMLMVTDFGIRTLIITSDHPEDPRFLRTCWTVQIIRGAAIFGLVLLVALGLYLMQQGGLSGGETVYGAAQLPAALAASGALLLIKGCESVNIHLHARGLHFFRITALSILHAALAPVLTIAIALYHPSIWALVIGNLAAAAVRMILTHLVFPGPGMAFCWDRGHRAHVLRRGVWILGRSGLGVVTSQADRFVLGAFLPAPAFGVYYLARQFFTVPEALVQALHGGFGLQVFRRLIALPDRAEMRARYYRYRVPMDAVTCLFAGGFLTAGPAVIGLVYDPRYAAAGLILQILGLGLPLLGMGMIREAFGAQQRFEISVVFGAVQAVTLWVGLAIALAVVQSPMAAFLVIALHRIPELAALLLCAHREGWVDLWREVRLFPVIGVGAALGLGLAEIISRTMG